MAGRRSLGNLIAIVVMVVAGRLPESTLSAGLMYAAFGYVTLDIALRARAGYLRRRPYWTRQSWRRYLTVCLIPIGALFLLVYMMLAVEWKLPIVGVAQSPARSMWAAGAVLSMLIGVGGVVAVVEVLFHGDPSRQFGWPRWLARRPDSAA